ncbi:probable chemoreceptor glutamine deamidase CheD 2 [Candidatus Vecturithrix granuli]|uniref:Probable chemoreceptor glutamine deamidase CheD 2 n=1 Tax=Vecturithrix granuli TaxID=1499967 RepID=A0A081BX13_VECG1|nr:probable chemoreceptor glutamine deamidase CheD 2 [Candidatus Vecturithrix granuli]
MTDKSTEVWTILGSCLAIIFYNPRLQLGAIAHAQLAEKCLYEGNCLQKCSDYCPGPCYHETLNSNPYKYVSCSIRSMLELFVQHGILSHEIDVQLFGGASILPLIHPVKSVGQQNIEIAHKMLEQYHLHVTNEDIGGTSGRTLYFYSDTGKVFLKPHRRLALNPRTSGPTVSNMAITL